MQHFRGSSDVIGLVNLHVQTQLAHAGTKLKIAVLKKTSSNLEWERDG